MLTRYRHVCGMSDLDTVRVTMILHHMHMKSESVVCLVQVFAVLKCEYMHVCIYFPGGHDLQVLLCF